MITIAQIIQRIKDLYLIEGRSPRNVDLAISYLRHNTKEAREYMEFCRIRLQSQKDKTKKSRPKMPFDLWLDYSRDCSPEIPISEHLEDHNAAPTMIAEAIETLINEEEFYNQKNDDRVIRKVGDYEESSKGKSLDRSDDDSQSKDAEFIKEPIENRSKTRRKQIDDYIQEVFDKTGKRLTRKMIWQSARYKTATEFERWQRNSQKCTQAANERFKEILINKPHLK